MNAPSTHFGFARKYRPQGFDEVVGQNAVSTTLKNAVADGQPAHAYLFFGPRGVGKTTTARILAKALNCEKGPTPEPCGKCAACREIVQATAIDVLELDAATHTQVDKIREMIVETASLAPSRDRYKIFIIDEVHMLSTASFNALLKTLEEPPAHVVFVLATTEPGKIPATIVSRCQRFRFRPLPVEILVEHLRHLAKSEKISVEAPALELLARSAAGSLRDAVGLLEQAAAYAEDKVEASKVRELLGSLPEDMLLGLVRAILTKDAAALGAALEQTTEDGYDPSHVLRDLRERLHASHLFRLGVECDLGDSWRELAQPHSPDAFSFLIQRVSRALETLRQSDSPRLSLEISLFGLLESAYDLGEWVARLEALESRLGAGVPSVSASVPAQTAQARAVLSASLGAQSPPVSGGGDAWGSVLGELQAEKPGLAHDLENCKVVAEQNGEWRLVFTSAFVLERAQNNLSLIESKMAKAVGHEVRLRLEVKGRSSASGEKYASAGENPPGPEKLPVEDQAVKKVLEFFPGKVRHIKK